MQNKNMFNVNLNPLNMNLNKLNTNFQKLKKLGLAFPELLGATSFKVTPFEYKEQSEDTPTSVTEALNTDVTKLLPPLFFNETFQHTEYVLDHLPDELSQEWFEGELQEKERILAVINSQLFQQVMENYDSFVQGMTHIHDLGLDLQTSAVVCKNGRRNLRNAKEQLTDRVAVIVSKYRKRQMYKEINDIITGIKYLKVKEQEFERSMEDGDYPRAINSILDCRSTIHQYKNYQAVTELMAHLTERYSTLQDKLDDSLYGACRNFTDKSYERILIAYRLLGQSNSVLEKLQKYFVEAINTHTKNALYAHVVIKEEHAAKAELYQKKKFRELCALLPGEHFYACLTTILEILTDIMYGHFLMCQWHSQVTEMTNQENSKENSANGIMEEQLKRYLDDIKDGLLKIKPTIWDNMQRKVSILISSTSTVADFQIDDFLKVLDALNRFVEIGEEFNGVEAHTLRGSIRLQSRAYFQNFHKSKMESLWTMLENEMWQRCPVNKNFISDTYSKEYNNFYRAEPNKSSRRSIFANMKTTGNPFSKANKLKIDDSSKDKKRIIKPYEDEDDELLNVDEIDEETGELKTFVGKDLEGPLITTTTINVIRFIGKYITMMKVLQPISYEIYQAITQLSEYYTYTIFSFFGEMPNERANVSVKLRNCINRLHNTFTIHENDTEPHDSVLVYKPRVPRMNTMLDSTNINNLFGISFRTVAIESLASLEECLRFVRIHISNTIPKARERNLNEFYNNTVDVIPDLIRYLIKVVSLKFIGWNQFNSMLANTNFAIKEIGVENNQYIDYLLKEFQNLSKRLNREMKTGTIPTRTRNAIWEVLLIHSMDSLIEGYSNIKRCTSEGRAMMSLDFKVFLNGLEKFVPIKPIPNANNVDNFIKAYYLTENDFMTWCKEHQEFNLKHWMSILNLGVNLGANVQRNNRQQFVTILEQMDKLKQPIVPVTSSHNRTPSIGGSWLNTIIKN